MIKEMEGCSSPPFDTKCRLLAEPAKIPIHLNCAGICLHSIFDHHLASEEWQIDDMVLKTIRTWPEGHSAVPIPMIWLCMAVSSSTMI